MYKNETDKSLSRRKNVCDSFTHNIPFSSVQKIPGFKFVSETVLYYFYYYTIIQILFY